MPSNRIRDMNSAVFVDAPVAPSNGGPRHTPGSVPHVYECPFHPDICILNYVIGDAALASSWTSSSCGL